MDHKQDPKQQFHNGGKKQTEGCAKKPNILGSRCLTLKNTPQILANFLANSFK